VSREDMVVGLDIGTTKVCTVVGHGDAQGKINILGIGNVPSRGIKKGVVIDVEDTVAAIRESVERARHMAGANIVSAVAGVTGDHIQSSNRRGSVTVSREDGVITQEDIDRVLQAASMDVPRDREIIHSLPRDFTVDGHRGVRRPIGMCGQRLEVETHVVTGTASFLQNVVQCVEGAGLGVEALVLEPIATSEAVATTDERELGVALIDIGGGTSDIAIFMDGSIVFSSVLPVGGNHVTRDISIGLRTPFDIAERLKIERGVASPALIGHGEALEVMTAGSGERLRLPRAILGEIIEARMMELLEMARDSMAASRGTKRLPAGVVLTGGGALLPGAVELAQQVFDLPVRLGKPIEMTGWSEQADSPQFSTAVGLLRFALRQRGAIGSSIAGATPPAPIDSNRHAWTSTAALENGTAPVGTAPAPVPNINEIQQGSQPAGPTVLTPATEEAAKPAAKEPTATPSQTTPFDRFNKSLPGRAKRVQSGEPEEAEQPVWRKWFAKLRQIIGFETS